MRPSAIRIARPLALLFTSVREGRISRRMVDLIGRAWREEPDSPGISDDASSRQAFLDSLENKWDGPVRETTTEEGDEHIHKSRQIVRRIIKEVRLCRIVRVRICMPMRCLGLERRRSNRSQPPAISTALGPDQRAKLTIHGRRWVKWFENLDQDRSLPWRLRYSHV